MESATAKPAGGDHYGPGHPHRQIDLDRGFPSAPQNLASRLVDFFSRLDQVGSDLVPRSIHQFERAHPSSVGSIQLATVCDSLVRAGMLVRGQDRPISTDNQPGRQFISSPLSNAYYCYKHPDSELAYGTPDHVAFGFPFVRKKFGPSVVAITGTSRQSGDLSIGTGFWFEHPSMAGPALVTAKHCIMDISNIRIESGKAVPDTISIHSNDHLDLAVLEYSELTVEHPRLRLGAAQDLDEVLVIGFPPVPRFDSTQLAETGAVAALQKSTVGEIASGDAPAYLERLSMILATTRTKGGSSGGPMINALGYVVGVVTANPADAGDDDDMGYTVALPSRYVEELLADPVRLEVLPCPEPGRFSVDGPVDSDLA